MGLVLKNDSPSYRIHLWYRQLVVLFQIIFLSYHRRVTTINNSLMKLFECCVFILWQWNPLHWRVDILLDSVTFSNCTNVYWPNLQHVLRIQLKCMATSRFHVDLLARNWVILISLVQVMHVNFLHRGVAGCALCYLLWRKLPLNLMLTIDKPATKNIGVLKLFMTTYCTHM